MAPTLDRRRSPRRSLTQSRPTGPDPNKEGWADQQISAARHTQQDQNSKERSFSRSVHGSRLSTWDLVAAQLDAPPRTRIDDRVYAASDQQLLTVVRELPDDIETVILVGHNPGIRTWPQFSRVSRRRCPPLRSR
jgi:phosphohistidine phosphatase SixA